MMRRSATIDTSFIRISLECGDMSPHSKLIRMKLVSIVALLLIISIVQADPRTKREELYRLNNLGVALMEQYKHEDATREFKKIIASDPAFTTAHINLALAYYFLNDSRNALTESRDCLLYTSPSPRDS